MQNTENDDVILCDKETSKKVCVMPLVRFALHTFQMAFLSPTHRTRVVTDTLHSLYDFLAIVGRRATSGEPAEEKKDVILSRELEPNPASAADSHGEQDGGRPVHRAASSRTAGKCAPSAAT